MLSLDSGELKINNSNSLEKNHLEGFYTDYILPRIETHSDMGSLLTSSVLCYSCHPKHRRGEPDRVFGASPGGIKILVVHHIPPDPANTNYLRRKCRAPGC